MLDHNFKVADFSTLVEINGLKALSILRFRLSMTRQKCNLLGTPLILMAELIRINYNIFAKKLRLIIFLYLDTDHQYKLVILIKLCAKLLRIIDANFIISNNYFSFIRLSH